MSGHVTGIAALVVLAACSPRVPARDAQAASLGPLLVGLRNALPEGFDLVEVRIDIGGQDGLGLSASGEGEEWEPALEPGRTRLVTELHPESGLVEIEVFARVRADGGQPEVIRSGDVIEVPERSVAILVEIAVGPSGPAVVLRRVPLSELGTGSGMCLEQGEPEEPSC